MGKGPVAQVTGPFNLRSNKGWGQVSQGGRSFKARGVPAGVEQASLGAVQDVAPCKT